MQVELALTYDCEESVSRELLLRYIHHNRDQNARRINSMGIKVFSFPSCMVLFHTICYYVQLILYNGTIILLFIAEKLLGEKNQEISELDEKLAAANLTITDTLEKFKTETMKTAAEQDR